MPEETSQPQPKEKGRKVIAGIIIVLGVIVLIFAKYHNPDLQLKSFIFIGAIIIVFAGLAYFSTRIMDKIKKAETFKKDIDTLPDPAPAELLWHNALRAVENDNYMNHISEHIRTICHNINQNIIYEFVVRTLYDDTNTKTDIAHILINAHFPDRIPTVVFNPSRYELYKYVNSMSSKPFEEPDIETTITHSPALGVTTETTKKSKPTKRKKPVEEPQESLQ